MKLVTREIRIKGTKISPGLVMGRAAFFFLTAHEVKEEILSQGEVLGEVTRFREALLHSKKEIEKLKETLKEEKALDGVTVLEAHLHLLEDPEIIPVVEDEIKKRQRNAAYIFDQVIDDFRKKFYAMEDPFFRERFKDLEDVSRRILSYLNHQTRVNFLSFPKDSVIFAKEISASDAAEANPSEIKAFVTEFGGEAAHAAIVARAKGIPYLSNLPLNLDLISEGDLVIVDGHLGELIINPSEETLSVYKARVQQSYETELKLEGLASFKAETFDGYEVRLSANIEVPDELESLHKHNGSGVGLFRSEYLFLAKDSFPTEEEQFAFYKRLVDGMRGLPCVIRTFDLGGDKLMVGQKGMGETASFLGCRAIRFCLKEKGLFKVQLRAILRASQFGKVKVMFPMVSTLSELREAKALLYEARDELIREGQVFGEPIPVGCMVEVPSAAIISDLLARECDFLSIGTNDLVQYSLAVDRTDHSMSRHYTPTHPSVLRLIRLVAEEAGAVGIPVSVCGEIAADPKYTALLLGLGINELSVSLRFLPIIKQTIRELSIVESYLLAEKALELGTSEEIDQLLDSR